ncbi:MAG: hypothetical protein KAS99_06610, partial [Candidatus Omnitrophica bacterium]|nr:hypothetical protein [Candidatus Omnitrophota bacterium]
ISGGPLAESLLFFLPSWPPYLKNKIILNSSAKADKSIPLNAREALRGISKTRKAYFSTQ